MLAAIHNKKGMTLPELLIAMGLIAPVLFGAGVLSIQTAKNVETVYQSGRAISEKTYVMSTLSRLIANGVVQNVDGPTQTFFDSGPAGCNCPFALLALQLPAGDALYFYFIKSSNESPFSLYFYDGADSAYSIQISHTDTMDLPDPYTDAEGNATQNPFSVDLVSKTVTFRFKFNTPSGPIESSKTVALRGGAGVTP